LLCEEQRLLGVADQDMEAQQIVLHIHYNMEVEESWAHLENSTKKVITLDQ
jgi:hypothetical protein